MTNKSKTVDFKLIEKLFKDKLSVYVKNRIKKYNLKYKEVTHDEEQAVYIKLIDTLLDPYLVYSGPHRLKQWENGWGQNLKEINKATIKDALKPKYFGKYQVNRLDQKFVNGISKNYEQHMLYIILDYVFDKYLRKVDNIYEFGCGAGHNLLRANEVNSDAALFGLDWTKASQEIIKKIGKSGIVNKITGYNFDFFKPNTKIKIENNSGIYTVAALEQTGSNYKKFVQYLIKNKPQICIHVEPIGELLNENNLIDNLSIKYFKKRNYLNGFLEHLREQEKNGLIKIHTAKRSFIGSMFIEGYSIIVWSPITK
jgi:hypothetical protein